MKLIYNIEIQYIKCKLFDVVFQGMVDYRVLQIHSTFRDKMEVIGVTFQPPDSRFYYQPPNTDKILLFPDKHTNVSSGIYSTSSLWLAQFTDISWRLCGRFIASIWSVLSLGIHLSV